MRAGRRWDRRRVRRGGSVVKVFVLIPLARGDRTILEQTRRLTAEVLPVAHGWS